MPNPRSEDHAIRLGTFTSSGIRAQDVINAWTVQSDQIQDNQTVVLWLPPYQSYSNEYARIAVVMDLTARPDGFQKGVLGPFKLWTFGMIGYAFSTLWPGGVYSSLVTMRIYDPTDTAVYLNCTLYRPVYNDQFKDYEPVFGGWQNINLRYDGGTITS